MKVQSVKLNVAVVLRCQNETVELCVFLQHKVFLVPTEQFSMEYVKPEVHCISTHGQFSPDR